MNFDIKVGDLYFSKQGKYHYMITGIHGRIADIVFIPEGVNSYRTFSMSNIFRDVLCGDDVLINRVQDE